MLRLIKADFYRLFHSKVFHYILLVTIGLAGGIIISESFSAVAIVNTKELQDILDSFNQMDWNLMIAFKSTLLLSSLLTYLSIGLFTIISGYEFSQKTYRNTLASGVSRVTFVLSKYFVHLLSVLFLTALYLGSALVFAFIRYGTENVNMGTLIGEIFFSILSLTITIVAILSLANVLLISSSSSVLAAIFIVVYPLGIQIVNQISRLGSRWSSFKLFDLLGMVQRMAFEKISGKTLIPSIAMNVILMICTIIASAWMIKKKEL
ncbi:ABC transporter permease [Enterococcus sp. DIV0187]|uniref:ABC transporter permease n=1 Tax=Enterococcus sp. DIV0187 TaxID=2774644 RepID=UPI003F217E90